MADGTSRIELTPADLRTVAGFAVSCAGPALAIFEDEFPGDGRPRAAVDAAYAFAEGSERTKALRDRAWDAQRAAQQARDAGQAAAAEAARAALAAAGAAFLHPLAKATQVKHILGAAAHAARAFGISAADDPTVGLAEVSRARALALPHLADVLEHYPPAPSGGGRVGELMRMLDTFLRRPQAQQVLKPTRPPSLVAHHRQQPDTDQERVEIEQRAQHS